MENVESLKIHLDPKALKDAQEAGLYELDGDNRRSSEHFSRNSAFGNRASFNKPRSSGGIFRRTIY